MGSLFRKKANLGEGAQAFKAASHSRGKAALAPKGGEEQAVLGRVGLVGAM